DRGDPAGWQVRGAVAVVGWPVRHPRAPARPHLHPRGSPARRRPAPRTRGWRVSTWPARECPVAIPTITARADAVARVIAWWRRRGVDPVVELQDPRMTVGPSSHVVTCIEVIRRALEAEPGARHVLLCEDDVEIDPVLPDFAPMLLCGRVVTLWTTRLAHLPARMVRAVREGRPLPRTLEWARNLRGWH